MSRLTEWLSLSMTSHRRARTQMARVELYTRWTFASIVGIEVGLFGSNVVLMGAAGPWLWLFLFVHAVLCAVLVSRAMDWRLGRRTRPVKLLVSTAALSAVGLITLIALRATDVVPQDSGFALLLMGIPGFGLAAISLGLRTTAQRVWSVVGTVSGAAVITLLLGLGWVAAALHTAGVSAMTFLLVSAYLFSAWLVDVVWELDAAREVQTRLAVTEERLRFGRDIHDVLGRNLAVIALKSELAVQLAERGRPEAIDQMTEVQRIAQESQREVREVVRGYREADLHTELEGARSVLAAAGIDCRVEGDNGAALPAEVQSALGWVVREATTNVLRHGDAQRCTVRLSEPRGAGMAVLVVENDGMPDPALRKGASRGSGLDGLRERLAALGGTLDAGAVASSIPSAASTAFSVPSADRLPLLPLLPPLSLRLR